jgi:agmatinase
MKFNNFIDTKFLGSCNDYNICDIVIIGVPMDFTCSYRPGTRVGPKKIREVSIGIEEFSFYSEKNILEFNYYDAGDIDLPFGNVQKSLNLVEKAIDEILNDNKFPITLGGEHLISLPVIKSIHEKYGNDLMIIHLDAHADLREDYLGENYSHASVVKRVCEFVNPKNIYQLGIRSGTKDELEFARKNTNIYLFEFIDYIKDIKKKIDDKPVYITLDIDVVDPAYANGTGTPEPGGCSSTEIIKAVLELMELNVVGFDLVEVSPYFDSSDRTALLAAKLIREVIINKK